MKKKDTKGTWKNSRTLWKKTNLQIIDIDKEEESQVNSMDQIFNWIIEEKFPQIKKDTPM